MIEETVYSPDELEHGVCKSCGEESDEILKGDGRCVDCIEEEKFINQTMSDILIDGCIIVKKRI